MATYDRHTRSPKSHRGDRFTPFDEDQEKLGDLLRRFAQDAGTLVRQEIALAKLELRENVKSYAHDAAKVGIAAGIGLVGVFALVAFAIIGLGDLLDNYWLSSAIVAALLLAVAGVLGRSALAHMRRNSVAPETTVATLQEDKRWVKDEAREMKRQLKA